MVFCTPAENKYTDTEHCPYTKNKLMHNLIILITYNVHVHVYACMQKNYNGQNIQFPPIPQK